MKRENQSPLLVPAMVIIRSTYTRTKVILSVMKIGGWLLRSISQSR